MSRREEILDAALTLFNADGTGAVSTNHIADALRISPGNLYYHFRHKEAIIAALFERHFAATASAFDLPADRPPTLADLERLVRSNFSLLWHYRFIYRELPALLRRDPALRERYTAVRARGYAGFAELLAAFSASGVLLPLDHVVSRDLADLCWLITEFWLTNLELSGTPADAVAQERGVTLLLRTLRPYMRDGMTG